ncbi:acyl-CoA carboxylase subunit epsilon [Streptomyces inhibens]|uniref:acyl-CoA carboxylase subunit epsilon n=1 Tax=Streptomyces inhibens TaxID=2293571 RepID=UPI0037980EE6
MNAFTDESTATGEGTKIDESAPGGEALAAEEHRPAALPEFSLRIDKGHAEPEELAAITVVLCAQLASLRALAGHDPGEERPADRRHPRGHRAGRSACWSGCWTCS